MRVWISKYALSNGITEHDCDVAEGAIYVSPGHPFMSFVQFRLGTEAHTSREAAVAAAERARKKKIESLRRQIAKLEKMTF